MSRISIAQLFEDKKDKLKLTWITGQAGANIELSDEEIAQSGQGMIGHLNFIHPDWIQVISSDEIHYLNKLDAAALEKKINQLTQINLACIIVADNAEVPPPILNMASANNIPLLHSPFPGLEVIWLIRTYLSTALAPSCSLHGGH